MAHCFSRSDGKVFKGNDFSDTICKKYVLKKVVVKTGEGDDDYILRPKCVKTEEYDLQKEMEQAAKGTDLKSLVAQCVRAGENPDTYFRAKEEQFADVTNMPNNTMDALNMMNDINGVQNIDSIRNMSKEELQNYISSIIAKQLGIVADADATVGDEKEKVDEKKEEVK